MKLRTIGITITLTLGLFASTLPPAAAKEAKVFRVGVLSNTNRPRPHYAAFVERLRKLGYVEGKNLTIEARSAEGRLDQIPRLAAELVRLGVDVIVASGAEANLEAARQATSTIPIVMVAVDYDPLPLGYIASLSRPGGNITGVVFQQLELTAKRLELLKEAVPHVTRIAVFSDVISADQLRAAEAAAKTLGVTLLPRELSQPPYNFAGAFRAITQAKAEALLVLMSPLMRKPKRTRIPNLAIQHRLPTIFGTSRWIPAGGLLSYGPEFEDIYRRVASYVDRILKGADPGKLPVEQPTKFQLAINLKTAEAIGLTMPPLLVFRAEAVTR